MKVHEICVLKSEHGLIITEPNGCAHMVQPEEFHAHIIRRICEAEKDGEVLTVHDYTRTKDLLAVPEKQAKAKST